MKNNQSGFTLIEILIVLFIVGVILVLPSFSLWGISRSEALLSSTREVAGVLHQAQTYTIAGKSTDGQQPISYGIYFQPGYYVLFSGSSYNANDTNNEQTDLPQGISFSQIQIPNNTVLFTQVTGQVTSFDASSNYVELQDANTGNIERITITQLGAVNYN